MNNVKTVFLDEFNRDKNTFNYLVTEVKGEVSYRNFNINESPKTTSTFISRSNLKCYIFNLYPKVT